MACVSCATPLAVGAAYCPQCGRFVDDRVEAALARYFALNKTNPDRAAQMGPDLKKLVPRSAWPHLADRLGPEAVDAWEMEVTAPPPSPAPASKRKSAPRQVIVPDYRPQPPEPKDSRAVFMDFNEKPAQIVAVMAAAKTQTQVHVSSKRRARTWLWLLFPAGVPFLLLDVWLGYNLCTFSLVTLVLWLSALYGLSVMARQARPPQFDGRFDIARDMIHTLQDDIAPKRTMMGWLDLTGFNRDHKKIRQKQAPSGRPVAYYKDEWLRLKMQLYDGSVLRVSLIEKVKDRKGYSKRSRISGKQKWKAGSTHKQQYLQVAITANPEQYTVRPFPTSPIQIPDTAFAIQRATAENGRITLNATAAQTGNIDAWDVLHVLRFAYGQLQPL